MPLFTSRINHAIPRILNGRPGKEVVGKTERARSGAALRVKLLGVSDRLAGPINFRFNLSPIRATMRRSNVFFNKFHAELSLNLASRPICIVTGEYEARLEIVVDFDFSKYFKKDYVSTLSIFVLIRFPDRHCILLRFFHFVFYRFTDRALFSIYFARDVTYSFRGVGRKERKRRTVGFFLLETTVSRLATFEKILLFFFLSFSLFPSFSSAFFAATVTNFQ